jgi:hypothetical protein
LPGEFPADIELFIQQHIDSLAQLETLLMLHADSAREWEPADVAKALYTSPEVCAALLADLARRGFLQSSAQPLRYRYQPTDSNLDRLIGELNLLYQERRVAVITLIYSKPVSNVQTFADSFRLRREK